MNETVILAACLLAADAGCPVTVYPPPYYDDMPLLVMRGRRLTVDVSAEGLVSATFSTLPAADATGTP